MSYGLSVVSISLEIDHVIMDKQLHQHSLCTHAISSWYWTRTKLIMARLFPFWQRQIIFHDVYCDDRNWIVCGRKMLSWIHKSFQMYPCIATSHIFKWTTSTSTSDLSNQRLRPKYYKRIKKVNCIAIEVIPLCDIRSSTSMVLGCQLDEPCGFPGDN